MWLMWSWCFLLFDIICLHQKKPQAPQLRSLGSHRNGSRAGRCQRSSHHVGGLGSVAMAPTKRLSWCNTFPGFASWFLAHFPNINHHYMGWFGLFLFQVSSKSKYFWFRDLRKIRPEFSSEDGPKSSLIQAMPWVFDEKNVGSVESLRI